MSKIEGIPEGWELVRIGRPMCGEFRVDAIGKPIAVTDNQICAMDCPIIRKIEKPKQYRPFANAAEAEPFWDRKLRYKSCPSAILRISVLGETLIETGRDNYTYQEAFDMFECTDGTPFGVEVTE